MEYSKFQHQFLNLKNKYFDYLCLKNMNHPRKQEYRKLKEELQTLYLELAIKKESYKKNKKIKTKIDVQKTIKNNNQ